MSGLKGDATTAGDTLGELEALITSLTSVVTTLNADASTDYDTLKEIGDAIGVNESRVSQLHARAIGRLKHALGVAADAFLAPSTKTEPVAKASKSGKKSSRLSLVKRGRDLAA